MTALPSVELLLSGSLPVHPGYYVIRQPLNEYAEIAEVSLSYDGQSRERLAVWFIAGEYCEYLDETDIAFIARIYPDRIGQG